VQQQQRKNGAQLAASERDSLAPVEGFERAEDAKFHASGRWAGSPTYRSEVLAPSRLPARYRAVATR
jgi:hypothetical protein